MALTELRLSEALLGDLLRDLVVPRIEEVLDQQRAAQLLPRVTVATLIGNAGVDALEAEVGRGVLRIRARFRRNALVRVVLPEALHLGLADFRVETGRDHHQVLVARVVEPVALNPALRKLLQLGKRAMDEPLRSMVLEALGKGEVRIPVGALLLGAVEAPLRDLVQAHPLASLEAADGALVARFLARPRDPRAGA